MKIHSTAQIHGTATLDGDVEIGAGTSIGPYCHIVGSVKIGRDNRISAHCVIGAAASHRDFLADGRVCVGDRNFLGEFSVVERAIKRGETTIGSDCLILSHTTVAHNSLIKSEVTLSSGVKIAGFVIVQSGANLGMGVLAHQYTTIGANTMLGMGAIVTKDVPPFVLSYGNPNRLQGINVRKVKRLGLPKGDVQLDGGRILYRPSGAVLASVQEFLDAAGRGNRKMLAPLGLLSDEPKPQLSL